MRVIGVDLGGVQVTADLGTPVGRAELVETVRDPAPEGIAGILANGGVETLIVDGGGATLVGHKDVWSGVARWRPEL